MFLLCHRLHVASKLVKYQQFDYNNCSIQIDRFGKIGYLSLDPTPACIPVSVPLYLVLCFKCTYCPCLLLPSLPIITSVLPSLSCPPSSPYLYFISFPPASPLCFQPSLSFLPNLSPLLPTQTLPSPSLPASSLFPTQPLSSPSLSFPPNLSPFSPSLSPFFPLLQKLCRFNYYANY